MLFVTVKTLVNVLKYLFNSRKTKNVKYNINIIDEEILSVP